VFVKSRLFTYKFEGHSINIARGNMAETNTPKDQQDNKPTSNTKGLFDSISKLAKNLLALLGILAGIVSCLLTFLTFVAPNPIRDLIVHVYNVPIPTPETIVITVSAPTHPPLPTQQPLDTYTPYPTYTIPPNTPTPEVTITPSPTPFVINVDYEAQTKTRKTFWYILSTIEVTKNDTMRLNMSFWAKTDEYGFLRLDLKGCAYVSDRDNGNQYAFVDSNYNSGEKIVVNPNSRVDYWFDFENAISKGAKNLTIGLCPNFYAGDFFDTFNIVLSY